MRGAAYATRADSSPAPANRDKARRTPAVRDSLIIFDCENMPAHSFASAHIAPHSARLQTTALRVLTSNHGDFNRKKTPAALAADIERPTDAHHRERHPRHLRTAEPARAAHHQTARRVRPSAREHRSQSPHRSLPRRRRVARALERIAQARQRAHHRRNAPPRQRRRGLAESARDHSVGALGAHVARRRQQQCAVAHLSSRARSHGVSYRTRHRDRRTRFKPPLPPSHRDHQRSARAHAQFSQSRCASPFRRSPARHDGSSPTRSSPSTTDTSRSKPTPAPRASRASSNRKSSPIVRSSRRE